MVKNLIICTLFVVFTLCSLCQSAVAGGFDNSALMGMKAASMGGTFTGIASDASASFYNPAGMSFIEYTQISAGAAFRIGSTSYLSPYSGNSDMTDQFSTNFHFYGVSKINEKTAIGLSINTPFCLRNSWDENWTGRFIVRETKLSATYMQPSVSYMFGEKFSVAVGPNIALGKTFHARALPYNSSAGEVGAELDGNSIGFGFNIGLFLKASDNFRVGLNYRSSVNMKVDDGDVSFSNVPSSLVDEFPSSTSFSTEYTLPSVISLGTSFNVVRELIIGIDISYTTWSSFDTLEFDFKNEPQLDYGNGMFYENTFTIRFGAEYKASDKLAIRGGIAFDQTPVPDDYLSPANPDSDKFSFSVGGSFMFSEKISLDVAYMLESMREREVSNSELQFSGNYKSVSNNFGLTLNYVF